VIKEDEPDIYKYKIEKYKINTISTFIMKKLGQISKCDNI